MKRQEAVALESSKFLLSESLLTDLSESASFPESVVSESLFTETLSLVLASSSCTVI